jgi:glutamate-5-semialdehyde dehydrogenase
MGFTDTATAAKSAAQVLAVTGTEQKNAALAAMAGSLLRCTDAILAANRTDVHRAEQNGTAPALIDRLQLDENRLAGMATGLRELVALPDPVGQLVRGWTQPNGLHIDQIRVPLGVIGIIYEARPNVTADAAGICLKAGNAVLLRGSSSAVDSNRAIVEALRAGLALAGLPLDCVSLVEGPRSVTDELMRARGLVDVLIPRGGAGLIQAVVTGAQVPVIETGTGNCHLFVDSAADQQMALQILLNAKTQRPSVCNALETLLVDARIADRFVPMAMEALSNAGVTVHGDPAAQGLDSRIVPAAPDEFDAEYLSLDLAVAIVPDLDGAIAHIRAHSSGHSETIVTNDLSHAQRFTAQIDAAAVLVNASSRFVDGGEFGFGAEIGISTQKLHARGPMGLPEMTTTKYVLTGQGQIRG